ITKLDKGQFMDSEFLVNQKSTGMKRKLVAFEMQERAIPRHGYSITIDGQIVGKVTSGTQSPCLNKGIGLGYVPTEFAVIGGTINILIRDKAVPATIVKSPFVKNTSLSNK
ncbi:MAG: glycine cleavage system aminomethyltransferase GcvT, partial [Bacteroidia bacterium]|nr:glycine cleavage system aminomethyltransferase GcvT [Bacteroidia bacterium]